MGPWVHGGWAAATATASLGARDVQRQDRRLLPRADRVPVLRVPPEGQGHVQAPRGLGLRDRHQPVAAARRLAAEERQAEVALFPRRRPARLRAAGRADAEAPTTNTSATRPSRSRILDQIDASAWLAEYMVADQRFAARRPDVLVYQTEVLERRRHDRRPDRGRACTSRPRGTDSDWIVKLIDVYPDDYPDPKPNPAALRMGGYQQLVRGDVMRGKFRNSFEKPEPFEPGKPTAVQVHAAGRLPHLPHRPPDHGAGAEQLVPAGGPQPADVRGHLQRQGIRFPKGDPAGLSFRGDAVTNNGGNVAVSSARADGN